MLMHREFTPHIVNIHSLGFNEEVTGRHVGYTTLNSTNCIHSMKVSNLSRYSDLIRCHRKYLTKQTLEVLIELQKDVEA